MINENKTFLEKIEGIKSRISNETNDLIEYEEFIAIPHFGFIILRFNLNKETTTIDELDKYETYLYQIIGNEFLIDFMGSVYKKVGVDFTSLGTKLKELNQRFDEEQCDILCPFIKEINEDKNELLNLTDYPLDSDVWEIQYDEDGIALILLGSQNRVIKELDSNPSIVVREVSKEECFGLVKATFYAKSERSGEFRQPCCSI